MEHSPEETKITIDGKPVPFEPGDTIIRAAWRQGIEIPHYCWHPGLSVAANCRMCLVHIKSGRQMEMPILKWNAKKKAFLPETKPKLQPACQIEAQAGMEIDTAGPDVANARASVQEFLLLNHPVDCPICDQAGECKLQDYWLDHQTSLKRKRTEPVHKPKGVRFGPTIVYDAERCIMCTRCIRVCEELVGDPVLDMRERGNRNEIVLAPGRQLDHRYTLMTEHVCPVGALTSRDFRFKARVWFLKASPTVCPGCATGCNAHADHDPRYGKVYRLRPRDNPQVNQHWMCDDGMMTYISAHEGRMYGGLIGRGDEREGCSPTESIRQAAARFSAVESSRIAVVLSALRSSEDNFAAVRFAETLGTSKLYVNARPDWVGDDILRSADQNPNRAGVTHAAGREIDRNLNDLMRDVAAKEIEAVLLLGSASTEFAQQLSALGELEAIVNLASNESAFTTVASVVIPTVSWLEDFGTFRNRDGLDQQFRRAVPAPPGVQPAWKAIATLAAEMGRELGFSNIKGLRALLNESTSSVSAQSSDSAAAAGATV
ncbi:MAG: 2Fe-2S iron-sulfur cluster-binding protein [Myxococcota bacterium]